MEERSYHLEVIGPPDESGTVAGLIRDSGWTFGDFPSGPNIPGLTTSTANMARWTRWLGLFLCSQSLSFTLVAWLMMRRLGLLSREAPSGLVRSGLAGA